MQNINAKLKMTDDWVLVRMDPRQEKTPGGVVAPDTIDEVEEHLFVVTVVAVGPGHLTFNEETKRTEREKPDLEIGQRVLVYHPRHLFNIGGVLHGIIQNTDPMAIVTDEAGR